jgi:putative membrane protein
MIRDYVSHAANERTFLAWVRTGVAIMALGFVIEKFDLFVHTISLTLPVAERGPILRRFDKLSGSLASGGGGALVIGGVALIAVATLRFIHTRRLIADEAQHGVDAGIGELVVLAALLLLGSGFVVYLAVG